MEEVVRVATAYLIWQCLVARRRPLRAPHCLLKLRASPYHHLEIITHTSQGKKHFIVLSRRWRLRHRPICFSSAVHHTQAHVQTLNLTHSGHHPRPSSAGHVTPSPGSVTPTNLPSPTPPPGPSSQAEYDAAVQLHKRPRLPDWPS